MNLARTLKLSAHKIITPIASCSTTLHAPIPSKNHSKSTSRFRLYSTELKTNTLPLLKQGQVDGIKLTAKTTTVKFPSGRKSTFHYVWLRDHCREPISYHPKTKQRLVDSALIDKDIQPEFVDKDEHGLLVTWKVADGGHTSFYPWKFLAKHSYEPFLTGENKRKPSTKIFWTSKTKELPTITYEEVVSSEKGVYNWLKLIDTYGFSFVSGIPFNGSTKATESLLQKIAFIRETHYGGFWDFTADLKHGDLAYSNEKLRGHTDTTYFTDACGLQLFHLLSPPSSHKGGQNLLIDGFRAASIFKSKHPDLYELFSGQLVPAHASGTGSSSSPSGVHMAPLITQPVFIHEGEGVNRVLKQVRWNADDRGPIGGPGWKNKMSLWYHALREWETILRNIESTLTSTMVTGTAVIFDNHRVLHGRTKFSGERRLCGGYISGDDYRSRFIGLEKLHGPGGKGKLTDVGVWDEFL